MRNWCAPLLYFPIAVAQDVTMLGKAAAGLAGLGLMGGAGTVIYNNSGDATVKIKDDRTGRVETVHLSGSSGRAFSCPLGTSDKLEPHDIRAGRIKLTMLRVRRELHVVDLRYPSHRGPHKVVVRYNALVDRHNRLVTAFNAEVGRHNAILRRDCTPAD